MNARNGMQRFSTHVFPSRDAMDARFSFWYRDDMVNLLGSTFTLAGGAVNTLNIAGVVGRPGRAQNSVTAVATPDRVTVSNAAATIIGLGAGGGVLTWEQSTLLVNNSDGVDNVLVRDGFGDNTTGADNTNGCYFENDRSTFGDNAWRACTANAGVRTKTTTGIVPTAGVFEKQRIVVAADGSQAVFSVQDAGVTAIATNMPTAFAYTMNFVKTLGATARVRRIDYYEMVQLFPVAR